MSSQRGNVQRKGPPKHANRMKFKNDLHDKTKKIQIINSISVTGCCARCKDIIEWKIKYKKYKLLSQAKTCVRCKGKTIKRAYYIVCDDCAERDQVCAKCGQAKDIVLKPEPSAAEELSRQNQLEQELKFLPERQRRTFFRAQASGKLQEAVQQTAAAASEVVEDDDDDDEEDDDYSDDDTTEDTDFVDKSVEAADPENSVEETMLESGQKRPIAESADSAANDQDTKQSNSIDNKSETPTGKQLEYKGLGLKDSDNPTSTNELDSVAKLSLKADDVKVPDDQAKG